MIFNLKDKTLQSKGDNYWVAPSASVIGDIRLDNNVGIWFGAVLRGDNDPIIIGENTNIQDNSVCHTDSGLPLMIGKNVTIGHKVILHSCEVGDNSLIGMGSTLLNRAKIGNYCLIGANSLVTEGKEFADNSLIMGSPAKFIRELTDMEKKLIDLSAFHYVENMKRYKNELLEI